MEFLSDFRENVEGALRRSNAKFLRTPPDEHASVLTAMIDEGDIVIGVFDDPNHPRGWSYEVIKLSQTLGDTLRGSHPIRLELVAIKCGAREDALTMRFVFSQSLSAPNETLPDSDLVRLKLVAVSEGANQEELTTKFGF